MRHERKACEGIGGDAELAGGVGRSSGTWSACGAAVDADRAEALGFRAGESAGCELWRTLRASGTT